MQTPDGVRVFKRSLRLPNDNFIELQYDISEFPALGVWFIEAAYTSNVSVCSFTYLKYYLFGVNLLERQASLFMLCQFILAPALKYYFVNDVFLLL